MTKSVAGLDRWRRGWVAVILTEADAPSVRTYAHLADCVADVPDADVIAADVPIGLPAVGSVRQADLAARNDVGARWPSVFLAPPRVLLEQSTVHAANEQAKRLGCAGVSAQTYALRAAIFEAESVAATDHRVFEVHPEVSFRTMSGKPLG